MKNLISIELEKRKEIIDLILNDSKTSSKIELFCSLILETLSKNNKLIFCGNGGSAAQSCHISAELSGRFLKDRKSQKSIVLGSNLSSLTAISNDYSFEEIFSRELDSIGNKNDLLICYSTSGNSKNIIDVLQKSKEKEIKSILFTGKNNGLAEQYSHYNFIVPTDCTPTIQEIHLIIGHIILDIVDSKL